MSTCAVCRRLKATPSTTPYTSEDMCWASEQKPKRGALLSEHSAWDACRALGYEREKAARAELQRADAATAQLRVSLSEVERERDAAKKELDEIAYMLDWDREPLGPLVLRVAQRFSDDEAKIDALRAEAEKLKAILRGVVDFAWPQISRGPASDRWMSAMRAAREVLPDIADALSEFEEASRGSR